MGGTRMREGYGWAVSAGLNAVLAAVAAKFFCNQFIRYSMVGLFNLIMWGCYVSSLKALSSLQATVTNFATNFLSSGLAGFFLFKETLSAQWFAGALFIVIGVVILSKSSIEQKESLLENGFLHYSNCPWIYSLTSNFRPSIALEQEAVNCHLQVLSPVRLKWMMVGIVKTAGTKQINIKQLRWLMQAQPSMKQIMAIMAERDAAIHERNMAISEKKAAIAERDMAFIQRDSAIAERNNAIMERDNAIATLQYRENSLTSGNMSSCPPGCQISRGVKHMHHPQQHAHHLPHSSEASYGTREIQTNDPLPISPVGSEAAAKSRRGKRSKDAKVMPPSKKTSKSPRKVKRENEDLNKIMFGKSQEWKNEQEMGSGGDDLNKQLVVASKSDWKGHDLGLNQIAFDDSTMPAPVCSCTGVFRQCYKWGNGGWQSSCCTTTLSMYPLPAVPNKRHARVGGRKMSGSAFSKLLSRLAAEGYDLSNPVDLKDHWAKHGTNRYITIK